MSLHVRRKNTAVKIMMPKPMSAPRALKPKTHYCLWTGCDKAFNRRPDMLRHVKTVHEKQRNHHCLFPGCGKSFGQPASLATHENTHTGERPYECFCCRKSFRDQSSCARHVREQHTGLTYYCPYCASSNKRATDFRNHLRQHNVTDDSGFNMNRYKLSQNLDWETLATLPQFNEPDMDGIDARRKASRRGRTAASATPTGMPFSVIEKCGLISLSRTPSLDSFESFETTPALTASSVSPNPNHLDIGYGCSLPNTPQLSYNSSVQGNALGVDLHTVNCNNAPTSYMYASATDISPALSTASAASTGYFSTPELSCTTVPQSHYTYSQQMTGGPFMDNVSQTLFDGSGLAGHDHYEYRDDATLGLPPTPDLTYQNQQYQQYTTPISKLARSASLGKATAWEARQIPLQ